MKRTMFAALSVVAATAAFAAPASAQDLSTDVQMGQICKVGEPLDTCLLRVTGEVLYKAGDEAEKAIDTVDALCRRLLSGCSFPV